MTNPTAPQHRVLYGDRIVPCHADCPENLDRMLADIARAHGARPALQDGVRRLSYAELADRVAQEAAGLAAHGIAAGDRVAVFLGNRLEFVTTLFALWRLGAVAVPIGIRQAADELAFMLGQCGAVALMHERDLADRVPEAAAIPTVRLLIECADTREVPVLADRGAIAHADLAGAARQIAPSPAGDEDPACIMYTSGTTGRPKGAVLTHLGFWHTARNYRDRFGYTAEDRMLLVIPITHISGLLAGLTVMMNVGGLVVLERNFKAATTLDVLEREAITAAVLVPAMYNLLLLEPDLGARDLSAWRVGHFGGAAMAETSITQLAQTLPQLQLLNGFGSTETTSAVSLTEPARRHAHLDSVGTLLPCVDIRVLDEAGREVPPGENGELWIRSPGNASGYWDNPEATRKNFVAGYWRSGDIGSVDAERYLRVHDRIKDMINRGGFKVYCVELENVIHAFPGVVEVAAVGTPCPVLGERVHVFVHGTEPIDPEALRAHVRTQLADYKTPDFVTQTDDPLPRNLNGKLSKVPLRERARAEAETRTAPHNPKGRT
ncbi:class I adenylate-forming enzyme family protein [Pseudooceanicola aestuarii]|uniref:class I adenylate-forming enzyme family protein n=1 Tax=Pseudooceanicola aestuarii TaxID=2697319 RepID=UPI0013D46658|nr:class I adenylate-forming enzyme family protein [Pseudooceanicola aestuarii]